MVCSCSSKRDLAEISQNYTEFVAGMRCLDTGDWIKLLQCDECGQLWRTDEWDKYQPLYALKLSSSEGWKTIDMAPLIKQRLLENHGGVDASICLKQGCTQHALKGRAFCVDHFYEGLQG